MWYQRHRIKTWLSHEQFESRLLLSAVAFVSHDIIALTQADGAQSVYAADVSGDGLLDVLSASYDDGKIAWYENTDSAGTFGEQQVITTQADFARSVHAADLDGDGDMDVLSASAGDDKIAWYENTDSAGAFGQQQVITTQADSARSVYATDLDGDGDLDVLSASHRDDKIAWYRNTGAGTFGPQQVITTRADAAASVHAADLDGDGDADVLSASQYDNKIAWYENTNGAGAFGQQQVITTSAGLARSVFAADVDGDGDLDVLSASARDDKIAWYENIGSGVFGPQQVITTQADAANAVYGADLDKDVDIDVLSASVFDGKIAWYENRIPGDANDDGRFDSSDLVRAFQAGEYEDNLPSNSNFDEGDWNGDLEFDSSDLVFAFQAGTYIAESTSADVTTAVDWLFAEKNPRIEPSAFVA